MVPVAVSVAVIVDSAELPVPGNSHAVPVKYVVAVTVSVSVTAAVLAISQATHPSTFQSIQT